MEPPSRAQLDKEEMQRLERNSQLSRARIDEESESGDANTLNTTVWTHIQVLGSIYVDGVHAVPLARIEHQMHDFWYTCITAAKNLSCANPKQDTLVRLILAAKARGYLARPPADDEPGCFSDGGRLWHDLPFLGQGLVNELGRYYAVDYPDDKDQRASLAAFVGRLISVGIYDGAAACALSLFREALETSRPLVSQTDDMLPVNALMYPLEQLLVHAEGGLAVLVNRRELAETGRALTTQGSNGSSTGVSHVDTQRLASVGELAGQTVGGAICPGFGLERWRFWLQRLGELASRQAADIRGGADTCLEAMRREEMLLIDGGPAGAG